MDNYIPATKKLKAIQLRLLSAEKVCPFTAVQLWQSIPKKPGIYAVWPNSENGEALYVGESSNLSERLKDFGRPTAHTFAKQIKLRNSLNSTPEIKSFIQENYLVSYISLAFGRAEAEEFLITDWATYEEEKFNDAIPRRWRCNT